MDATSTDIVIIGGGMAGLSAAIVASQAGLQTTIVEKSSQLGGSAALSAGMFWAPRDIKSAHNTIPFGDPTLQAEFIADYPKAVQWMRDNGIEVASAFRGIMSIGIGYPIDIKSFLSKAKDLILQNSASRIVLNSTVTDLITASPAKGSRVCGITVRHQDGNFVNIHSKCTIVATGGFQGSSRFVSTHIGPGADDIFIRSNPYSTGDGYCLAQQAGSGLSRGLSTFYGHLLPSPLQNRSVSPNEFIHLAQFQSSRAILVNSSGKRFCDETYGDEVNNQHLAKQPGRIGYMILNQSVRQKYAVGAPFPNAGAVDRLKKAKDVGGRVTTAPTIAELIPKIAAWGVPADSLAKTLADYSSIASEVVQGRQPQMSILDAPMGGNPDSPEVHMPLDDAYGPYHALEVQPSITFTYGGAKIESGTAKALTVDGVVIPGLYIVGMDAGGFNNWRYCGGLALAFVTGKWAASDAVKSIMGKESMDLLSHDLQEKL